MDAGGGSTCSEWVSGMLRQIIVPHSCVYISTYTHLSGGSRFFKLIYIPKKIFNLHSPSVKYCNYPYIVDLIISSYGECDMQ